MSLLENISKRRVQLRPCDTIITLPSGEVLKETRTSSGNTESTPVGSSHGFVIDLKPCLEVTSVIPGLCMGSQDAVQSPRLLKGRGVTHVLSLGIIPEGLTHEFKHLYIPLLDEPNAKLKPALDQCSSFIDEAIQCKGCVYVHCNAGISRSASVVIGYLMKNGMSYSAAYDLLKSKRKVINPNKGFVAQLKELESDKFNNDN